MDDDTALDDEPAFEDDTATARVRCLVPEYRTNTSRFATMAEDLCRYLGVDGAEVNIDLLDDLGIQNLNKTYRGIDRPTDVLAFPQMEWQAPVLPSKLGEAVQSRRNEAEPPLVLGDIAICLPEAQRNADNIGQSLSREVCFLAVHGFLHLVGHDHHEPDEEALMLAEQAWLIDRLAEQTPAPWHDLVQEAGRR